MTMCEAFGLATGVQKQYDDTIDKLLTLRASRPGQIAGPARTAGSLSMRRLAEFWNVLDNELDEASD